MDGWMDGVPRERLGIREGREGASREGGWGWTWNGLDCLSMG